MHALLIVVLVVVAILLIVAIVSTMMIWLVAAIVLMFVTALFTGLLGLKWWLLLLFALIGLAIFFAVRHKWILAMVFGIPAIAWMAIFAFQHVESKVAPEPVKLAAPKFNAEAVEGKLQINLDGRPSPFYGRDDTYDFTVIGPDGKEVTGVKDEIRTTADVPVAGDYKVTLVVTDQKDRKTRMYTYPDLVHVTGPAQAACQGSWKIVEADHGGNRFFAEGVQSIKDATDAQAPQAARDFADQVKTDPVNLSGAVLYILHETVDPATLRDGDCASNKAVEYASRVQQAVLDARSITVENAPSNGTNSGVNANGEVVVNGAPGISGDMKAIKIVLKDGTVIWIMGRCGNFVTIEAPASLPQGPTDQVIVIAAAPTTTTPAGPTTSSPTPPSSTPPTTTTPPPPGKNAGDSPFTSGSGGEVFQPQDQGGTWHDGTMTPPSSQPQQSQSSGSPQTSSQVANGDTSAEVGNPSVPDGGNPNAPANDWNGCLPDGSNC